MATFKTRDWIWQIWGNGELSGDWYQVTGSNDWVSEHWTVSWRPSPLPAEVGLVDMSLNTVPVSTDTREMDRLTLSEHGPWKLHLKGVEHVDAPLDINASLEIVGKVGFTTDGSLMALRMNVGHHVMDYTGATRDSTLFMGAGYDTLRLVDDLDVGGDQKWALIRRSDGEVDAYSLFSGYRVRLQGGAEAWGMPAGSINYGEIEEILLKGPTGDDRVFNPGNLGENPRASFDNIDLRSDGALLTDSFNLAYFNLIRYTSDNVWVGEATVHNGTANSTPGNTLVSGTEIESHPVIGDNRNGTHDLVVAEQAAAIDGEFRLYTFNLASGLYNSFNRVYLGTSGVDNKSYAVSNTGSDPADRVAVYGFGGNDVLVGGAGKDYLFGGLSSYNQINQNTTGFTGNLVTGGDGADYFGVGNTNAAGAITGSNVTVNGIPTGSNFLLGAATDVITDWNNGPSVNDRDTLVVLSNGVAVIGGLYGQANLSGNDVIDLRSHSAVAISDQDSDGARTVAGATHPDGIANDGDVTVVNQGLIVARGLAGNDTLYGSTGMDYLYGGSGNNTINLGNADTKADRVYIDSSLGQQRVHGFEVGSDQIYLNSEVIDALANAQGGWVTFAGFSLFPPTVWEQDARAATQTTGQIASSGTVFSAYTGIYEASLSGLPSSNGAWSNSNHEVAGFSSEVANIASGAALVAVGVALLPFDWLTGGLGSILIAAGAVLAYAGSEGQPHLNATYDPTIAPDLFAYANVLTATKTATGDNPQFLDFFDIVDDPSYAKGLEILGHNGSIFTFLLVYSDDTATADTFIYAIASKDSIIQNNEAILVAQVVDRQLTIADIQMYAGSEDPYNQTGEPLVPNFPPEVSSLVVDASTVVFNETQAIEGGSPVVTARKTLDDTPTIRFTLDKALAIGDTLTVMVNGVAAGPATLVDAATRTYAFTDSISATSPASEVSRSYQVVTASGSLSSTSGTLVLVYDPIAPVIRSMTATETGSLSFLSSEGGSYELKNGGTTIDTDTFVANTSVSLDPVDLSQTGSTLTLTVKDGVGNSATAASIQIGTNGNDTLGGGTQVDILYGLGGDDSLSGGDADDQLFGGAGNDTLNGGAGNNLLTGGLGTDTLMGGAGADTAYYNDQDIAVVVDLSAGTAIRTEGAFPVTDTLSNVENVVGSSAADTLTGDSQVNSLTGGGDNDTLAGGSGNDTLTGGAGNDHMTGGADRDTFIFEKTATDNGADTVTDFVGGANGDTLSFSSFIRGGVELNGATTPAITLFNAASNGSVNIDGQVVLFNHSGASLTETQIAATFGTSFDATGGGKHVFIQGETGSTAGAVNVYYIDSSFDNTAGYSAADVQLIATLASFDIATLTAANIQAA